MGVYLDKVKENVEREARRSEEMRMFGKYPVSRIERFGWKVVDAPGKMGLIDKDALMIDPSYQRNLSQQRVRKIVSEWSWMACGAIVVAERNGQYYVIDGQHRVNAALLRKDITDLPCIVFETQESSQEAGGFYRINLGRKSPRLVEQWKARMEAGEPTVTGLSKLFASYGYTPDTDNTTSENTVMCIGTSIQYYEQDPEMFKNVFRLLVRLCAGNNIKQPIMGGIWWLASNVSSEVFEEKWLAVIDKLGLSRLETACKKASIVYGRGGVKLWGETILTEINKGRSKKLAPRIDRQLAL